MENCQYASVHDSEMNVFKKRIVPRKPFLRQIFVCSGGCVSMFLYGFYVGGPTVFIPQIRKEANSTNVITDDMASWLSSALSFSSIPFIVIMTVLGTMVGKKKSFIIGVVHLFVGFIILYFSTNITFFFFFFFSLVFFFSLLISQLVHGVACATQITIINMILTEYTSPTNRGLFLIVKTTIFYWGVWVVNTIGTFYHWKMIPLIGMILALYAIFIAFMCPESPYWLASKGKFEDCATAHRWLKGCDEESERELEALIRSQKEYVVKNKDYLHSWKLCIPFFFKTIKSKEFYKSNLIALTTLSLSYLCGKLLCIVYALDIIKKMTKSESTAYMGMLLLDGVTVASMSAGCILARYLKRRIFLLVSSSIGAMFLFILSLYLYLITLEIITENTYVSIVLLTAFSIAVSCGPLIMGHAFFGEIVPVRSRNLSFCLIWLGCKLLDGILLKMGPFIFKSCGLHRFFLIFGISSSAVILILYKYFPETKDKSLQEIADIINGTKNVILLNKNAVTSEFLDNH